MPSRAPQSLQEFVQLAKAKRGNRFVAIPQIGAPPHIVALLLNRAAEIEVTFVPHKSGSEALMAVVSGEIPFLFDAPAIVNRLNRELDLILGKAEIRELMAGLGFRTMTSTPEHFRALILAEHEKWGALIRNAGLKLN